jgi:hypothetical protein
MARKFGSAAAFKTALEARLRKKSEEQGVPLSTLQLKFVIERLLARLFRDEKPPWLLKGASRWTFASGRRPGRQPRPREVSLLGGRGE